MIDSMGWLKTWTYYLHDGGGQPEVLPSESTAYSDVIQLLWAEF
jgi:hypothetical protein